MRGEYAVAEELVCSWLGSSPHAWRIFLYAARSFAGYSVHPHMRGEYVLAPTATVFANGSSPHAWRICDARRLDTGVPRFIPTCVENMYPIKRMMTCNTVHPHMRGEYVALPGDGSPGRRFIPTCVENMWRWHENQYPIDGSSPHAWRIFTRHISDPQPLRFIPTCVENIFVRWNIKRMYAVHPHMRGEYGRII